MNRFCSQCGAETNDARFCPRCGKQVIQTTSDSTYVPPQRIPPTQQVQPKKPKLGCLIFILLLLIVPMGFALLASQNVSPASPEEKVAALKKEAGAFDEALWTDAFGMVEVNNALMYSFKLSIEMGAIVGDRENETLKNELWSFCKKTLKSIEEHTFPAAKNEREEIYLSACEAFRDCMIISTQSMIDCLEDPSEKNLLTLAENMPATSTSIDVLAENRGSFLVSAGFTLEEIEQKLDRTGKEAQ